MRPLTPPLLLGLVSRLANLDDVIVFYKVLLAVGVLDLSLGVCCVSYFAETLAVED